MTQQARGIVFGLVLAAAVILGLSYGTPTRTAEPCDWSGEPLAPGVLELTSAEDETSGFAREDDCGFVFADGASQFFELNAEGECELELRVHGHCGRRIAPHVLRVVAVSFEGAEVELLEEDVAWLWDAPCRPLVEEEHVEARREFTADSLPGYPDGVVIVYEPAP